MFYFGKYINYKYVHMITGESLMKHCGVQIPKLKSRVTKVAAPEQQSNKSETSGNKKKKGRK